MFSKGWCIITSNYIRDDWIHTYIMALLYYIVVCIVNVSASSLLYPLALFPWYLQSVYVSLLLHSHHNTDLCACLIQHLWYWIASHYKRLDAFQDCYQKMLILNNDGLSPYLSPAYLLSASAWLLVMPNTWSSSGSSSSSSFNMYLLMLLLTPLGALPFPPHSDSSAWYLRWVRNNGVLGYLHLRGRLCSPDDLLHRSVSLPFFF